jgi:segregation and condensation protein B
MATLDGQPEAQDAVLPEDESVAAPVDESIVAAAIDDDVVAAPVDDDVVAAPIDEAVQSTDIASGVESTGGEVIEDPLETDRAIEALLFVSRSPLTINALAGLVAREAAVVRESMVRLADRYAEGRSGIVLAEVAGGYQLRSAESEKARVRELLGIKPQRLTRPAMETLALVAYRQPVTRPEIEAVRGVDCGAVLKALLERGMLRILGKKEEPGRPLLYGTTREFLSLFGLSSLSALPTLREFRELSEEHRSLVERETAAETTPPSLAALADSSLSSRLAEMDAEGENALADLEAAMEEAEARSKLVAPVALPVSEPEVSESAPDSVAGNEASGPMLSKNEASA